MDREQLLKQETDKLIEIVQNGLFEDDEEDDEEEDEALLPGSGWVVMEVLLQLPKMLVTVEVPA